MRSRAGENNVDGADPMRKTFFNRRSFIRHGTLFLAGSALAGRCDYALAQGNERPKVRVGLVTDLHYAEKPPARTRHYRETLSKLAEAASRFEQEKVDCIVAVGDMIDAAGSLDVEKEYLRRIARDFAAIPGQHHFVLGNHCVYNLTKAEFLGIVGQERSYYSFDMNGVHVVVLDACFRCDGQPYGRENFHWTDANVPAAEVHWLRADLEKTPQRTIVFVHQRLDVEPSAWPARRGNAPARCGLAGHGRLLAGIRSAWASRYGVKNASEIRRILEESGKVLAVVQGHYHKGDYQQIAGVHYCTLRAMVEGSGCENNAYAIMDVLPDDTIRITGFRKQTSPCHQA